MWPFSVRKATLIRRSVAAYRSSSGRTCGAVEASSAMHSSQCEYAWANTESMDWASQASGGLYTGSTIEITGWRAKVPACAASAVSDSGVWRS